MKKTSGIIFLFVLLILTSCGGSNTSTTSSLKVTEKGHSNSYKEYWIKAYDPNNDTEDKAFKIIVNEEMVWNLIEEDKEYFTSYSKEGNEPWILNQIEHMAKPQK
ncbi:hypothetical protein [Bacillus sp. FJAT-22090]|uniref:hypothetical protein n=1 Tax=Bacillus sp. FJAT-22090 TaxID=1581038 RepID=UPI0011A78B3C|nr:hypothetical protein [Bacillus sp. FJAT-22090]